MSTIIFLKGDATVPQSKGPKVIPHICNDLGKWGKGFVLAISKRWTEPEVAYRRWHRYRNQNNFSLGQIQLIQVEKDKWIANMVAQRGTKIGSNGPPIRYDALNTCLKAVSFQAKRLQASIHMPRIGCGLAGGRWNRVEPLIRTAISKKVQVYVYSRGSA